ncbi:MAG: MFS transporter [Salinispira sp.]
MTKHISRGHSERSLRILLTGAHFILAMIINTSHPLLVLIQDSFEISIAESGILPAVISISLSAATLILGIFMNSLGRKATLLLSFILTMGGCLFVAVSDSFVQFIIAYAIIGAGIGSGFVTGSTIYAGLRKQNFGLYHGFFGLGGMAAPLILKFWVDSGMNFRWLFFFYLAVIIPVLITAVFFRIPEPVLSEVSGDGRHTGETDNTHMRVGRNITLTIASGVMLISSYAVAEVGASTWAGNMSVDGYGLESASFILSGFWLLFTLSRFFSDRIPAAPPRAIFILTLFSLIITALWMAGVGAWLFIVLGASFGPVFPVAQKHINSLLPDSKRALFNGLTYAGNGIGIMIIVPVMGLLGNTMIALAFIPTLLISIMVLFLTRVRYVQ